MDVIEFLEWLGVLIDEIHIAKRYGCGGCLFLIAGWLCLSAAVLLFVWEQHILGAAAMIAFVVFLILNGRWLSKAIKNKHKEMLKEVEAKEEAERKQNEATEENQKQ